MIRRKQPSQAKHDIAGQRFGSLVALECKGCSRHYLATMWLCQCDCGRMKTTQRSSLLSGRTKTCGGKGCKGKSHGGMKIVSRTRRPVELPLIKVRWAKPAKEKQVEEKRIRPAHKVPCKLQKVFARDCIVRKYQGLLTRSGDVRDAAQIHPFLNPDDALSMPENWAKISVDKERSGT